jgi:GT2 family glycosyltransferase
MKEKSITCVVIGRNTARTLRSCLQSLKQERSGYIKEITYVDGGSKDESIAFAKAIEGIKIIEHTVEKPTPGKQRNAGWKSAGTEWIHFFDGDTTVDKNWISEAVKNIDSKTAAIFGWRKEVYPRKNYFHFIADLEWTEPKSEATFFGGDVLIRKTVLEETGGYDESLTAGEDPELSARIRSKGWKIKGVDTLMCYHDINMAHFRQYFARSARSGYAYAEVGMKMLKASKKTWFFKTVKISVKAVLFFSLVIYAIFSGHLIGMLLAFGVLFSPLTKTLSFKEKFNISFKEALAYGFHCSIIAIPHFFGITAYLIKVTKKTLTFILRWSQKNYQYQKYRVYGLLPLATKINMPIFVIGSGSSGTSILAKILALHKDVYSAKEADEAWFIADNTTSLRHYGIKGRFHFDELDFDKAQVKKLNRIFYRVLKNAKKKRLLEKTPHNLYRIKWVKKIFPDAKFIHTIRNGKNFINSIKKRNKYEKAPGGYPGWWWRKDDYIWHKYKEMFLKNHPEYKDIVRDDFDDENRAAIQWITAMEKKNIEGLNAKDYLEIKYEELTENPGRIIRAIYDFTGLDCDEKPISFAKKNLKKRTYDIIPKLVPEIKKIFNVYCKRYGYDIL